MSILGGLLDELLRPLKLALGIDPPPPPSVTVRRQRSDSLLVIVRIPGHIEPLERGEKFEDPLHDALQTAELGEVTGGGSQLSEPDQNGRRRIEFCEIEVDIFDVERGLALLRQELSRLQVPFGTVLQYEVNGKRLEVLVYEP